MLPKIKVKKNFAVLFHTKNKKKQKFFVELDPKFQSLKF